MQDRKTQTPSLLCIRKWKKEKEEGERDSSAKSDTLPLSKDAPSGAAIGQDEASPDAPLANLDDGLPGATEGLVVIVVPTTGAVLLLAGEANDFAAGALYGEFGGLLLLVRHGAVGIVAAALAHACGG